MIKLFVIYLSVACVVYLHSTHTVLLTCCADNCVTVSDTERWQ